MAQCVNRCENLQVGAPYDVRISTRHTAEAEVEAPPRGTTVSLMTLIAATGVELLALTAATGVEEVVPSVQSAQVLDPVTVDKAEVLDPVDDAEDDPVEVDKAEIYLVFVKVDSREIVTVVSPSVQSLHVSAAVVVLVAGSVVDQSPQTSVEVLLELAALLVVVAPAGWCWVDVVVVEVQSTQGSAGVVVVEVVVVQSAQGSVDVVVVVVVVQSPQTSSVLELAEVVSPLGCLSLVVVLALLPLVVVVVPHACPQPLVVVVVSAATGFVVVVVEAEVVFQSPQASSRATFS